MPTQNLNTYYYPKYKSLINSRQYFDLTLSADERDYDEEVVFSTDIIAANDGNRLPISIDLDFSGSSPQLSMSFGSFYSGGTLVSKNYYNPNNINLDCYSAFTGACDVGLVATDNGLFNKMSGQTLFYSMGIRDDFKFHPHYYDRRFKMHMVTGYTSFPNTVFSGRPKNVAYNIVSKNEAVIGNYQELYGGFYQGFYKLNGYDYEVFPERMNKGWSMEIVIKPRISDEYAIDTTTQEYLNTIYPNNSGTFFYFGTRAENKYYHFAEGSPLSDSGYTRATTGLTSLQTCKCSDTGVTNANCVTLYPKSATTAVHQTGCGCSACTTQIAVPPLDPKFDVLSNAMSIRFSGCPSNPRLCVKTIKITGDCVTTGSCETTGVTFQTGYTITEVCSPPIYDVCDYVCDAVGEERWVMVTAVFERYTTIEECDLFNLGGLNDIREVTYQSVLNNTTYNLIMPPETHEGAVKENKLHRIIFDRKWFDDSSYRMGRLKLYINGYYFMVIDNFEEIIPRELNCEKEKQIGVPFNISVGGGTQGLHDSLIFDECSEWNWSVGSGDTNLVFSSCSGGTVTLTGITGQSGTIFVKSNTIPYFTTASTANTLTYLNDFIPLQGPYRQDPELFPNNILSATTFSNLSTNILLEQNFGGTFMGGLSQFRMYTEGLSSPQVQHNFRILENRFNLFNYWCPNCLFMPNDINNLHSWHESKVDVTINGSNQVLQWDDISGNNNHLIAPLSAFTPYYVNQTVGTKIKNVVANFSSNTISILSGTTTFPSISTNSLYIFTVAKKNSSGGASEYFFRGPEFRLFGSNNNSLVASVGGNTSPTNAVTGSIVTDIYYSMRIVHNVGTTTQSLTINNGLPNSNNNVSSGLDLFRFIMFSQSGGQVPVDSGDVSIAEVIIYTDNLTNLEVQQVENYLKIKYNHY